MSKFTPGPWGLDKHAYCCVRSGDMVIANCGGTTRNFDVDSLMEQQAANTNLIASAPEMYEALNAIVKYPKAQKYLGTILFGKAMLALTRATRGKT